MKPQKSSNFAYWSSHEMLHLLPNRGMMGSQCFKCTKKKRTPNVNVCAKIHFQINISDLSTSTNPKKARFSSNSIFCQSSNETLKSEMFISTVHFGTSVDVERMFFLVRFRHWDPTNPRFGRRCSISYMRKKIERRPVSKIVAIFIAVQN